MEKVDYKKTLKEFYKASSKKVVAVDVPPMNFLMVDGKGDPNTSTAFTSAIEALYPLAYTLKFMSKGELQKDFVVMPLEGLWWAEDMGAFKSGDKDKWLWTLMIMQPEFITPGMVEAAAAEVRKKKKAEAPAFLDQVRFERLEEGPSAQILHIGPYEQETENIERIHAFIEEQNAERSGKHHEIYLSDARRTAPEKLKTIIRQPMIKK